MGNNSTKETRSSDLPSNHGNSEVTGTTSQPISPDRNHPQAYSPRSGRGNRSDLFFLGIGSSPNLPLSERRETKQEREARKLEKEKQARIKEREKSLKEEHVDGGFLVTMGIYTGVEEFNKPVVRQLMIERRLAPFWRGLHEYSESWNEYQLMASSRGLPIPASDEIPKKDFFKISSKTDSRQLDQDLASKDPVSQNPELSTSGGSDRLSPPKKTCSITALNSTHNDMPTKFSSIRTRSETVATLSNTTQLLDPSDTNPKIINLPHDPYVNCQPIEVYLYKNAIECPICFLSYPPYLNKTRCCDQYVCSECFVQIKRPDPHPPEHHYHSSSQISQDPVYEAELLVSEPACCPYCQQTDFGIIYEPPNFRRGLIFENHLQENPGFFHNGPTSSISNSNQVVPQKLSATLQKRRTISVSANAPTVVTTDRIRPDWAIKLANARSHLARRSAAATALHTAAYLIGNGNHDNRGFNFRPNRLTRNLGADGGINSGSISSSQVGNDNMLSTSTQTLQNHVESQRNESTIRRNKIQDIEELMVMEAIRLSLATEEDRKMRLNKESTKDTKKKAKEDKKREKKEKKSIHGGIGNPASVTSSSLNTLCLERGQGSSVVTTQPRDIKCDRSEISTSKGKEVDRRPVNYSNSPTSIDSCHPNSSHTNNQCNFQETPITDNLYLETVRQDDGLIRSIYDSESRLQQMSNASSSTSSFGGSIPDSPRRKFNRYGSSSSVDSPYASGVNMASSSAEITKASESNYSTEPESLLNFQSLTSMILGDDDVKPEKNLSLSQAEDFHKLNKKSQQAVEEKDTNERNMQDLTLGKPNDKIDNQNETSDRLVMAQRVNPVVIVTPGSPEVTDRSDNYSIEA